MLCMQALGSASTVNCPDARTLCLFWERGARRGFQDCLADEKDQTMFDGAMSAALRGAGLADHLQSDRMTTFTSLDLDNLPLGRVPFHQVQFLISRAAHARCCSGKLGCA